MKNQFFRLYGDIRKTIIGSNDDYYYINALTGRRIKYKNVQKYNNLILYAYNENYGYKSLTWLNRTSDKGIIVCKELFDQNNEFKNLKELYEAFSYIDFQIKPEGVNNVL